MRKKVLVIMVMALLMGMSGFSQEMSKKELKHQRNLAIQHLVDSIVNTKTFVFIANMAFTTGMSSINLSNNPNYLRLYADSIDSHMPFFGRAYSYAYGIGVNDNGLKFAGKPQEYSFTKCKREYLVKANLKTETDNFRLTLKVAFDGSASLTITSSSRGIISYDGYINELPAPKEVADNQSDVPLVNSPVDGEPDLNKLPVNSEQVKE